MKKKHVKFLKQLLETPSPTGFEEPAAALVRERLGGVADEVSTDTMGSVSAVLEGTEEGAPTLMLAAHMDEIGLMVTYISDEGFLSVASLGGVDAAILPGMRVDVHTASGVLRGVVGRKPIHLIEPDERKNVTPLSSLVIDLGMKPKRVKKLVSVGDPITFGVGFPRRRSRSWCASGIPSPMAWASSASATAWPYRSASTTSAACGSPAA